ncbi:MAG: PKD domain-containing protein [Nitrospiraceae bacterium]|nr:PKD domain-containing protein [Nitrospiraceae bacterium]
MRGANDARRVSFTILCGLCALIPVVSLSQECGAPTFPEAAQLLAAKGYPTDEYDVLLTWRERVADESGAFVTGYHLLRRANTTTLDLYTGQNGQLLDPEAVARLGIAPKNWDMAPVEQRTVIPDSVAKRIPARPVPVSVAMGVAPSAELELSPLDEARLIAEDEERVFDPEKSARRIGVVRDLDEPVVVTGQTATLGGWRVLDDGARLWTVTLASPGARAIRVHFTDLYLPDGAGVVLYNAYQPVEAYGPFTAFHPNDTDFYAPMCFADAVTVECYVPAGVSTSDLRVAIDALVHTYADFDTLQWAKDGSCNIDVSCHPEWADVATGVAGYTLVENGTQIYCCGALIADTVEDSDIPYFLTANHCIKVQDGFQAASNMEFIWLYQSSECGGIPPLRGDVPRTRGGADLLAGASQTSGTDFTLVRLRNDPPPGIPYLGWSTEPVPVGTPVVGIHHPSSAQKRISFGHLTDTGSPAVGWPLVSLDRFNESLWDRIDRGDDMDGGTTEHGSSGSPLFRRDNQLLVGQLYGGYAGCLDPEEPDYYGRFDVTFPMVQQWLAPTPPSAAFFGTPVSGNAPLEVQFTDESVPGTAAIDHWDWDFGDGQVSAEQNPAHTYSFPGLRTVRLTVTSSVGSDTITRTDYISVSIPPTAAFSASPASGNAPLEVQFTDESDPGSAAITAWAWDFGDGNASDEQNPVHAYQSAGLFTVSLTVITDAGEDTETKQDLIAVSVPPSAAFSASPLSGNVPLEVQFTDESDPGTSPITNWNWDFGNGHVSGAQHPTHTYGAAGEYNVRLVVTTAAGVDVELKNGFIQATSPPSAYFFAVPGFGDAPLEVTFSDASTAGTAPITSWAWDFDDGQTADQQNPTHVFSDPGSYLVTLTVTSDHGTGEFESRITVSVPPLKILNPASLPQGATCLAYSGTLDASGGLPPYTWTLLPDQGALPPGLQLSPQGAITGEPAAVGDYAFSARVTDSENVSEDKAFTLAVVDDGYCGGCTGGPLAGVSAGRVRGDASLMLAVATVLLLLGKRYKSV